MNVIKHYDLLIDEGNDAFRDPPALQEYMNKWDGRVGWTGGMDGISLSLWLLIRRKLFLK